MEDGEGGPSLGPTAFTAMFNGGANMSFLGACFQHIFALEGFTVPLPPATILTQADFWHFTTC